MAGVVDVVYVNNCNLICGLGMEGWKDWQGVGQLSADLGQEWMGIRHHKQEGWFSK